MLYPYTLNDHQNLTQTKNYTTLEIKKKTKLFKLVSLYYVKNFYFF